MRRRRRATGGRAIAAFRFIHTADIHLDSPLRSLAMRDAALAERVADATRQALAETVDLCLREQVDALLVAGDLYDGDQTSMRTARFIGAQMKRLADAGVRVFVIRGNHDNQSRITRELTFPEAVRVFGARAGVERIARSGAPPIVIHGVSFGESRAPESLLPKFQRPEPDAVNIGLMHTSLGGSPGHDVYSPCAVVDLMASGFRYWALGHIHRRSVAVGAATVVMPGMPQGRDINEDGAKSVTLATVADDGTIALEERIVGPAAFARVPVDVSGVVEWRALLGRAGQALADARGKVAAGQLIGRLQLHGATPLAWRIRRDIDLLRLDLSQDIGADRGLWIEMVETACSAAAGAPSGLAEGGPLGELAAIATESVLGSDAFQLAAGDFGEAFTRQLPVEIRSLLGDDETTVAAMLCRLAEDGVADVLARLRPESGSEDA